MEITLESHKTLTIDLISSLIEQIPSGKIYFYNLIYLYIKRYQLCKIIDEYTIQKDIDQLKDIWYLFFTEIVDIDIIVKKDSILFEYNGGNNNIDLKPIFSNIIRKEKLKRILENEN